jgi:hypothetical protein
MGKAFGITAMICGILSLIIWLLPYLGLPLGIMGIVFYAISKKKDEQTGMATAGLVTGILGTIINAIMLLFVIIAVGIASTI